MTGRPGTVTGADGRAKAYRPLPADVRAIALTEGLDAYDRGDFFEAHERLEPAWMGTADPAERDVLQGIIKVAAAYVHGVRGNPTGIARNLEGARDRLASAADSGPVAWPIDVARLVADIDVRLAELAELPADRDGPILPPPTLHRRPS